jgi:CRISPR-associated exonuclease Cas4
VSFTPDQITGTLIHYYATCKREAWLYAHGIHADQGDANILMGKTLAELKEKKDFQDMFSHLHFDKVGKQRGHLLVTEYKKSMKNPEGARMQLLFYMYLLKKGLKLKAVNGKVISGKQVVFVEGSEAAFEELEGVMAEISAFVSQESAPAFEENRFCRACGYRDYCF